MHILIFSYRNDLCFLERSLFFTLRRLFIWTFPFSMKFDFDPKCIFNLQFAIPVLTIAINSAYILKLFIFFLKDPHHKQGMIVCPSMQFMWRNCIIFEKNSNIHELNIDFGHNASNNGNILLSKKGLNDTPSNKNRIIFESKKHFRFGKMIGTH